MRKKRLKNDEQKDSSITLDLDDYVQVGFLNQKRFAEVLLLAKGFERTMGEYAEDCGLSPAAFSRYKNGKRVRPIAKSILVKMAEEARPDNGMFDKNYILAEFLFANGMSSKKYAEIDQARRLKFDDELISKIEFIVVPSLLQLKSAMRYENCLEKMGLKEHAFGFNHKWLAVEMSELMPRYYIFHFLIDPLDGLVFKKSSSTFGDCMNYNEDAYCYLDQIGMILLMDCWEPTKFKNIRNIFVFDDEEKYNRFVEFIGAHSVNSEMSAILVNMLYKCVVSEYLFPMSDDKVAKPLFDTRKK